MTPGVSVVIAVFNGANYIRETLDSIINQTFLSWECIIVDDGSSDDTCSIVKAYIQKDNRFRLIETSGSNGPYVTANIGIKVCHGKYVARIDADDIALPTRLQRQYDCLEKNSSFKCCATEHFNLFLDGRIVRKTVIEDIEALKFYLVFKNPLLHSSLFFEKKWFDEIGYYPPLRLAQDYYIWCEAITSNKLIVIHEPLVLWRITNTSLTKTSSNEQTNYALEINRNYVSKLIGSNMDLCISEITFGSFRKACKITDLNKFKIAIDLINLIQKSIVTNNFLSKLKAEFFYSIILSNKLSKLERLKLLWFAIKSDFKLLSHWLIYKLFFRLSIRNERKN